MRFVAFLVFATCIGGCARTPPPAAVSAPSRPASLGKAGGSGSGVEIYFVRHGETIANATGRYNGRTLNTLSATGEAQARSVAQALHGISFDAAIVSPSLRAEVTAAETLSEHGLTATIWPEFNECCTQHGAARLKSASKRLGLGTTVTVPISLASVLRIDPTDNRLYAPANYADGLVQTQIASSRIRTLLGHEHKPSGVYRLLIIGHSAQGSRFLDLLLDRKPIGDIELKNGEIVILRAVPGGAFKLSSKIDNPNQSRRVDPRMR